MISTKYTIREQNEATVLRHVILHEEISRARLSSVTKLNKASVSSIIKKLIDDQLVFETGSGNSSNLGGRKPTLIAFNGKSATVLSIDLGVDYIEGMISYLDGSQIEITRKKGLAINSNNVLFELKELIDYFIKNQPDSFHGIIGLTIAFHGIVFENEIIFTPYYDLDTLNLYETLNNEYLFPVFFENEANLAALGEYTYSSESQKIVALSIHSGLGAGTVENGEIHLGEHGHGGELGHTVLYPNGKPCPCGNNGCIEQYVSNKALYEAIQTKEKLSKINSQIIKDLYYEENQIVKKALIENIELLSIGINNISMIYDPEVVIINSSIYQKIPELITSLNSQINNTYLSNLIIRNTTLEDKAILLGGIALASQNFLNIKNLKLLK